MSSVVRIVKREERERSNNSSSDDGSGVAAIQQTTPEMIIKSWITASRNRRQTEDADYLRNFRRWDENRTLALGQTAATVFLSLVIATLIAAGFGVGSVSAKPIGKNTARTPAFDNSLVADHFISVESLRVHYVDIGVGPTVVMIHGNAGSVEDFEFKAFPLLSAEYRVVAVDRPGHGGSDRPVGKSATLEYQAELLHRTIASLGIAQPTLVGHSWGGSLALAYALKYPSEVSAMVLLAPAAYPDNGVNGLLRATVQTPVIGDLSLLLGRAVVGRRLLRRDPGRDRLRR